MTWWAPNPLSKELIAIMGTVITKQNANVRSLDNIKRVL